MSAFRTPAFRQLALTHAVVNAILLALGYYWLGIGESRTSMVAWSALLVVLMAGVTCCAYGAALVHFQADEIRPATAAWKTAWHNLIPLVVVAVMVGLIYWLLYRGAAYGDTPAFSIASYLTLKLRHPVKPDSVKHIFDVMFWILRWAVVPVFFLPALAAIATRGWSGVHEVGSQARRWLYWIQAPVLLLCAFRLPVTLLRWVPIAGHFSVETASFVIRAAIAYLLFTGAWFVLAFVTSAGKPCVTQSLTVESP